MSAVAAKKRRKGRWCYEVRYYVCWTCSGHFEERRSALKPACPECGNTKGRIGTDAWLNAPAETKETGE